MLCQEGVRLIELATIYWMTEQFEEVNLIKIVH